MKPISLKQIEEITQGKLYSLEEDLCVTSFSKDTRTLKENDVYVAIHGESFDGNAFYKEALEKKASLVILDCDPSSVDTSLGNILFVKDTIKALQDLACYVRSQFTGPVIAITGSVGKTSTKMRIAEVLKEKYRVLVTEGNYNNNIGLPLTILKYSGEDVMVLEMGMNHLGEIALLSKIAKPTIGVITNVGTSHIGNLGSRENILKAKLEIVSGFTEGSILLVNGDNDLLKTIHPDVKTIYCHMEEKSGFYVENLKQEGTTISFQVENTLYTLKDTTYPMVMNSMFAIQIGLLLKVEPEKIQKALSHPIQNKNRMEKIKLKNYTVIDDTYNASFESIISALDYLEHQEGRKVAILGDILEIGSYGKEIHEKIGQEIDKKDIALTLTVGTYAKSICDVLQKTGKESRHFSSNQELIASLKNYIKPQDVILVKASHGMHLEEIVTYLKSEEL